MSFIDLNTKVVLDPLYSQILSERAKLIIHIKVSLRFIFPFGFQEFERLLEYWLWPHISGIRCTCQSVVVFFHNCACTL